MSDSTKDHLHEDNEGNFWSNSSDIIGISHEPETQQQDSLQVLRSHIDPDTIYYYIRNNDVQSLDTLLSQYGTLFNLNSVDPYLRVIRPQSSVNGGVQNIKHSNTPISRQVEGGFNPLMIACQFGYGEIVQLLVGKYHASPLLTNKHGQCALHFALMQGHFRIVYDLLSQWYHHTQLTSSLRTYETKQDLLQLLVYTFTRNVEYYQSAEKTQEFLDLFTLLALSGRHSFNLSYKDHHGNTIASLVKDFLSQFKSTNPSQASSIEASSPSTDTQADTGMQIPRSELDTIPSHLVPVVDIFTAYHWCFDAFYDQIFHMLDHIISSFVVRDPPVHDHITQQMNALTDLCSYPLYRPFVRHLFTHRRLSKQQDNYDEGFFDRFFALYLHHVSSIALSSSSSSSSSARLNRQVPPSQLSSNAISPNSQTMIRLMAFDDVHGYSTSTISLYELLDDLMKSLSPVILSFVRCDNVTNTSATACLTTPLLAPQLQSHSIVLHKFFAYASISPYSGTSLLMRFVEDDNKDYLQLQLLQSEYEDRLVTLENTSKSRQGDVNAALANDDLQQLLRSTTSLERRMMHRVELIHYLTNSSLFGQVTDDSNQSPIDSADVQQQQTSAHTSKPVKRTSTQTCNHTKQLSPLDHHFNLGLIFSQLTTHDRLGLCLFDHVSSTYNSLLMFSFICHVYHHNHLLSLSDPLTNATLLLKSWWFDDTKKITFIQDNTVILQESTIYIDVFAPTTAITAAALSQLAMSDNRYDSPTSFMYRFSRQYDPSKGTRHEFLVNRWHAFYSQGQDDDGERENNHVITRFNQCVLPLIYRFPETYDQISQNKLRSHLIKSKLTTSPASVKTTNASNADESNTAILDSTIMSSFIEIIDMEFNQMIAGKTFRFDYRQLFSIQNIDDNDHIFASYFNDIQSLESESLSSSASPAPGTTSATSPLPALSFLSFIRLACKKTGISKDRYKKIIDAVHFYTPPRLSHQQGTPSRIDLYNAYDRGVSPLLTSPQYFSRLLQLDYDDFSQDLNYKAQFVRFIRRAEVDIITYAQQCHAVRAGGAEPATINVSLDNFIDTIASLEICLLQLFGTRDAPTTLLAMYTRCIDSNMVNHPCFVHFIRLFMVYYLNLVLQSSRDGDANAIQDILQPFYMIHNTSIASMTCSPYHLIMHHCALELVVPIRDEDNKTTTDDASATTMSLLHSHLKTLYDDQLVPPKYISHALSSMDGDHSRDHHVYDAFSLPVRYVEKLYEQQVMGSHPIRENLYSKPSSSSSTASSSPTSNPSQLSPDLPLLTWLFSLPQDCVDINDVSRPVLRVDDERDEHSSQHDITDVMYSILTRVLSFTLWTPSLTDLVSFLLQQPGLSLSSSDILWCMNAVVYHNHYEFHFPQLQEDIIKIGRGLPSHAKRAQLVPSIPFAPPQTEMTRAIGSLSIAEVLSNEYHSVSKTSIRHVYRSASSSSSSSSSDPSTPCLHGVMPICYSTTTGSTPLHLPSYTVLSHLIEYTQKHYDGGNPVIASTLLKSILFDAIDVRVDPELMRLLVSLCAEAETETDAGRIMYDPRPRSPFTCSPYTPTSFSSSLAASQPLPPMLPPSLVTYLLTTCMMTVNYLAPSSAATLASIVTYFKDILDVFAIAGFFNIPDNDLCSTENFLLPLFVIPHIHRNTKDLIESYFTTFTPLVLTVLKHSTLPILSSFDTTIPMSIFQYYSHSLKHGDNGGDDDFGNYAPVVKPSGRTTTINGKEYLRATVSISIQALVLSPPPFLHHTLLVNSIEQQNHLLEQLFNAGIDPNACVYNIHDFTMNDIAQCQCTSLEPSGNQTTFGDYDQQVVHSTLTLAIASTFTPNENTVNVKKDSHLQTADFKLLDLILSLPSTNVSLHLPLIVLGDIMTIYDQVVGSKPSNNSYDNDTSKERLLRKLVSTIDSVNDGSSSKHQQLFHTSPIAVALHQPRALEILQKLISHHSFIPQHVFSHDHHIDCLVTALCHSSEPTRLARRLLQSGCPIGHGVLRHSQHEKFPLTDGHDEQQALLIAHYVPISFQNMNRQSTTGKGIGGSGQVKIVQYNPHLHYGSYYAYYPPLHTLDHIVTQLLRMESSVDAIAKTKRLLLTDFHEYLYHQSDDEPTQSPPLQLSSEKQHEVEQCRDLTPFVKSFATLLRSVLFFALIASDISSSTSLQAARVTQNPMIAEFLNPQDAVPGSDVKDAWEHYMTVFDPHQMLIPSNNPSNHRLHDIDATQAKGVRTQRYIALNQLVVASLSNHDDAQNKAQNDTQNDDTTIRTYFYDCIQIQKDIHSLLLFDALGQTNCVELLTIFHSFDDGHTFNISSTIHPTTNDSLPLYAAQFHLYNAHMVECMQALVLTYRCLVNVISSHFRLSLIELLFVQLDIQSSSSSSSHTPTPFFPIDIFKLLVENNCDIRHYDRCTSNHYYGSTLLVLACFNHSIHQIALSTSNILYPSDHIQLPMTHHPSYSDSLNGSALSVTSTASTSSPSDNPTQGRQNTSAAASMISGAQLVIDTLVKLGCAVNTQFDMDSHQPVGNDPSQRGNNRPHSQLLYDILHIFRSAAPSGILIGLINNGATLSTASIGYKYASNLTHPDDPEVSALVAEALCQAEYRYVASNKTVADRFLLSLYSHPYSHRMVDSMLTRSTASLGDITPMTGSNPHDRWTASYFRSLSKPHTRNCEALATVLHKHGLVVTEFELLEVLHEIPPSVLSILKPPSFVWNLDTIIRYIEKHHSNLSYSDTNSEKIREKLGITTVYGVDFRKSVYTSNSNLLPLICYFRDSLYRRIPVLYALFYHLPEDRELSQIVRRRVESLKIGPNQNSAAFPMPELTARTVSSFVKEMSDPPSVYLTDFHHPRYMMAVQNYISSDETSMVNDNTTATFAAIEAETIRTLSDTNPDGICSRDIMMKFKPLIDYYLDPASVLLRDAISPRTSPSGSNVAVNHVATLPNQNPPQTQLFQQVNNLQPSTKYLDIVPPLVDVALKDPSRSQFTMINCNHIELYKVEGGIMNPKKLIQRPVKDIDSRRNEFLTFCYIFYYRFSDRRRNLASTGKTLSHLELALLNPYLTKTALETLLVLDEFQKQLEAKSPFKLLCHRHHTDRFYDCFVYLLSIQPKFVDETYSLTHSPTGERLKISPLVHLSMFHGNRQCLMYLWDNHYKGRSMLNSAQQKLLEEYCQPEYYDIFVD